ncbi:hypothetical protein [Pseudomonas protegens]|uniref:hypothetical protein n=1 Tax=Pseudomonas protegens TaxID=380021 RepID=UPI00403EA5FA
MGQASADAGPVLDLIKGEVDESIIGKELNKRIDWVDSDGPGSVNDRINQAVKDITDALVYDPSKAYAKGDVVRLGQKIYQAQGPVAVGVAPPAEPWQDIATILEQAGALAGEVHQNTLEISELDGVVTAQAEKIEGVFVQLNPLYSGDTGSYAGTPFLLPFLYQASIHWMFGVVVAVVVAVIPRCTPNDDYSGMAHE